MLEELHHELGPILHTHQTGLIWPTYHEHLPHLPDLKNYKPFPDSEALSDSHVVFALRKMHAFDPEKFPAKERRVLSTMRPGFLSYGGIYVFKGMAAFWFMTMLRFRSYNLKNAAVTAGLYSLSLFYEKASNRAREAAQERGRLELAGKYRRLFGESLIRKALDARVDMAALLK